MDELFTLADLAALPTPSMGVGSFVTLPSGTRGRIVALSALHGVSEPAYRVALGRGRFITVVASRLVLS